MLGNLFAWLILIPFILAFVVGFLAYDFQKPTVPPDGELNKP